MASRSHTVLLVALVEDIAAGRFPADVGLDGTRLTIPVFLAEFAPRDLDAVRDALGLVSTATVAEIAGAYDKRRRAPKVDPSRPYLDVTAIETRTGPVLLARLALALRHGGPIAGSVEEVDGRGRRVVTLRDHLDGMTGDRITRAEAAASTLGVDAVRAGDVARVLLGRLEAAGVLPKAGKPRARAGGNVMEHMRAGAR